MKTTAYTIQDKIDSIQVGLLRYKVNGKQVTRQVRITIGTDDQDTLSCVILDELPSQKLLNKNVTLIQKDQDNYMYIGGRISNEIHKNKLILSVDIKKACWYIRKSKGSVSWLQEKCVYLPMMEVAS